MPTWLLQNRLLNRRVFAQSSKATMESRPCVDLFHLPLWQLFPPLLQSGQCRLRLPRQYMIATVCKG